MAPKKRKRFKRKFIKPIKKFIEFNFYRLTGFTLPHGNVCAEASWPASEVPDMVILTPAAQTDTMQTINWRTSAMVTEGRVEYRRASVDEAWQTHAAEVKVLDIPELTADNVTHHFTATLGNLTPSTAYAYRVGGAAGWSQEYIFTTGPRLAAPFSFVYLGDMQEGFAGIGTMLHRLEAEYPETAFYTVAGDFVNAGEDRNAWDDFFCHTGNIFAGKFLAPTPGNHDYHRIDPKGPVVYVKYFELPHNGAPALPLNHSYTFSYGGAFFVVPDTNKALFKQTDWLKHNLKHAKAQGFKWLIVLMHHPVYSPKGRTGKRGLQKSWRALFDEYGVDLVLTGHDHSYMRSQPLHAGKPADNGGAVYIVSTAGSHFYRICNWEHAACQKGQTQTYQIINVYQNTAGDDILSYKAYEFDGALLDEFSLLKSNLV